MIEVSITDQMIKNATIHAMKDNARYGINHNNIGNIKSDKTQIIGSLGEEVISSYFNIELTNANDYDIIINQERVEIKTNSINVEVIKPYYECNIFIPSIRFDRYMFVFVHSSLTKAWIVGTCSKDEFEYKSYISTANIKDKKTQPAHRIQIKDLEDVESWLSR